MRGVPFLILAFLFWSCLDTELETTSLVSDADIQYLDASQDISELVIDPYTIVSVTPVDRNWEIIVEYSGGCEEHQFYTFWDGAWAESNPLQTTFRLLHVGNGDACKALVRDTVVVNFDQLFRGTYPDEGAIVTVNNTPGTTSITVHPTLAGLAQGSFCSINARLVATPCGDGIWANKWLQVQDSIDYHNLVWIQPVRNNNLVSLDVPDEGNYKIGITLLFGYEGVDDGAICQAMPEGAIVPATINCVTPQ